MSSSSTSSASSISIVFSTLVSKDQTMINISKKDSRWTYKVCSDLTLVKTKKVSEVCWLYHFIGPLKLCWWYSLHPETLTECECIHGYNHRNFGNFKSSYNLRQLRVSVSKIRLQQNNQAQNRSPEEDLQKDVIRNFARIPGKYLPRNWSLFSSKVAGFRLFLNWESHTGVSLSISQNFSKKPFQRTSVNQVNLWLWIVYKKTDE